MTAQEPQTPAPRPWRDTFGLVATRSIQGIAIIAFVGLLVFGLTRVSVVVIPVIIALILASAIHPYVSWLRRHGVPSIIATWLALVAVIAALVLVGWLISRSVRSQWDELSSQAVEGFQQLQKYFVNLPFTITEAQIESAKTTVMDFLTSSQFGSGAIAGISAAATFVTGFAVMVVILFFFLKDGPKMWEFVLRPFEGEAYERAQRVGASTVSVLGGYVRGTATVAAVDAIGIGIGLAILGVPLAMPLAVIVFILAFIPMVGATVAGILAALVALVANGLWAALIVIIIVVGVNQLEGNFLQPIVMGRSLKMHPLVILLALTVGTILSGIVGAVLAVPLTAVAWSVLKVWDGPDTPARFVRQKRPEKV